MCAVEESLWALIFYMRLAFMYLFLIGWEQQIVRELLHLFQGRNPSLYLLRHELAVRTRVYSVTAEAV